MSLAPPKGVARESSCAQLGPSAVITEAQFSMAEDWLKSLSYLNILGPKNGVGGPPPPKVRGEGVVGSCLVRSLGCPTRRTVSV